MHSSCAAVAKQRFQTHDFDPEAQNQVTPPARRTAYLAGELTCGVPGTLSAVALGILPCEPLRSPHLCVKISISK